MRLEIVSLSGSSYRLRFSFDACFRSGSESVRFAVGNPLRAELEAYLKQINNLLGRDWKDKPEDFRQNEAFIRSVSGDILTIKHSWRNPTMHRVSSVYTLDEANQIFDTTMSLMGVLAMHLKELTAAKRTSEKARGIKHENRRSENKPRENPQSREKACGNNRRTSKPV